MKRQILIRPEAEQDLVAARDWYDGKSPELGDRFLDEVAAAIYALDQDPLRPGLYYRNFRRVLLHRFPYKLFYQVFDQRVIVFRVLHAAQCHEQSLQD